MKRISTSERLLDVLTSIIMADQPLTVRDVASHCQLPISSAYRITGLLEQQELIANLGHDMGYVAGPKFLKMAFKVQAGVSTAQLAGPTLQALAVRTMESVALMVASGHEALCVDLYESPQAVRCSFSKGKTHPLLLGASAKTLLAFLPPQTRQAVLDHYLERGVVQEGFTEQLKLIEQTGYSTSTGEVDEGVWGASAPIFRGTALQGVITIMAPIHRASPRSDWLIEQAIAAAQDVTQSLNTLLPVAQARS